MKKFYLCFALPFTAFTAFLETSPKFQVSVSQAGPFDGKVTDWRGGFGDLVNLQTTNLSPVKNDENI